MKTTAIGLLAMTWLVGCAELDVDMSKVVSPPDDIDKANAIISEVYGSTSMPSQIFWYGMEFANCEGTESGETIYGWRTHEGCLFGLQLGDRMILMMGPHIYQSALAHERAHYRWDLDGHPKLIFGPGGPVDQANAALAAAGM